MVNDPANPEQPIGVVTKRDSRGRVYKYRVIVLGDATSSSTPTLCASELRTSRTATLRSPGQQSCPAAAEAAAILGQMDWLDACDDFLFSELDRIGHLRSFVWDVTMTGADEAAVTKFEKTFVPPGPNSTFVHNDTVKLEAKTPDLQAADTTQSARLLRNHVLGGSTTPEHWFGGGGM